ncbi:MAG: tetratricopeptide repeat protein [Spirochaetes bacterium]|nr:tetratricopeptide repeat protein [Spirochaetota bacterium]
MNHKKKSGYNDPEIIKQVNYSLELLKSGKFPEANEKFLAIMKKYYANPIAESGIKCIKYWTPRIQKILTLKEGFSRGKAYHEEWIRFEKFIQTIKNTNIQVITNLMDYIYNQALQSFLKDLNETKLIDLEIYYLIGLSYKKIGDFHQAILFFEKNLKNDHLDANAMAQLADCYALIDESKKAKVLFRESFFIDPSLIQINNLDSNMIHTLITKIQENGIKDDYIDYWIPVYAWIYQIFDIKRELLPIELGKLKQEIFYLEQKILQEKCSDEILTARLLNCYFWLIDFIKIKHTDHKQINEILNKIKIISPQIDELLNDDQLKVKDYLR